MHAHEEYRGIRAKNLHAHTASTNSSRVKTPCSLRRLRFASPHGRRGRAREHRTTSSRSTPAESRLTMPSGIGQRCRMPPRSTHVMRTIPWLARHPSRVGLPVLVAVEAIHAVQQPCIAHRCTVQRVVAARHAGAVRVDRAALIGAWGRVALTRLWPVRFVRNRTQRNKSTGSAKNLTLPVWPWSWGRCWAGPSAQRTALLLPGEQA